MRPTRWTRKRRATKPGRGGWSLIWVGYPYLQYTNPVTGDGVGAAPHKLFWMLRTRTEQEAKRGGRR